MKPAKSPSKPGTASGNAPKGALTKQAFQLAKTLSNPATPNVPGDSTGGLGKSDHGFTKPNLNVNTTFTPFGSSNFNAATSQNLSSSLSLFAESNETNNAIREKMLEKEIMADTHRATTAKQKSQAVQKNLNQMVNVLKSRLHNLEDKMKLEKELLIEDVNQNGNSDKGTKDLPKIVDDSEDEVPRSMRELKGTTGHGKDNLVSSDNVYIDPYHLILKTKAPTEAAKKLESIIEESFGTAVRDLKNKKLNKTNQNEKSKRSEQLKNEAKRMNRLRIEKKLQVNMESFVTRSVMDNDLIFQAPEKMGDEPDWPVSIRWSHRDERSQRSENNEGEFDPDLLLRYAIERINLPSGRRLFAWLVKQPIVQSYFVSLFWLIKVRFFESDTNITERELFLLNLISSEYRQIVYLLASRTHAEHEKDFVFRYFPFVLANGVFFGFFYIFPGSRHIYTKGFKKTIYMQIVQIMHGIQVCAISVKVSWAKLFPEDVHDEGEEAEDGGELFPVQIALKAPPVVNEFGRKPNTPLRRDSILSADSGENSTAENMSSNNGENFPSAKGGLLVEHDSSNRIPIIGDLKRKQSSSHLEQSKSSPHLTDTRSRGNSQSSGIGTLTRQNTNPISESGNKDRKQSTASNENTSTENDIKYINDDDPDFARPADWLQDAKFVRPVARTYLMPPLEKPTNVRNVVKRQTHIERLNAQQVSPQMSMFLASLKNKNTTTHFAQTVRRTIPVNWCPAGGSDTHHKKSIATDLHHEISQKLKHSQHEYHKVTLESYREKIKDAKRLDNELTKVLKSGQTTISRYSLDWIRQQRNARGGNVTKEVTANLEEVDMALMAQLAQYDDEEVERFLAEL